MQNVANSPTHESFEAAAQAGKLHPRYLTCFSLICVLSLLGCLLSASVNRIPFGADSASYIEQARFLMAGEGALSKPWGLGSFGEGASADRLFPPGFPATIVLFSALTGMDPARAAVWVARISEFFLPLLVFWVFSGFVGTLAACLISLLLVLSPGVLIIGPIAYTDVYSQCLVILSFALVVSAAAASEVGRRSRLLLLAGGLISGFSILVRNANLAWLISASLVLSALALWAHIRKDSKPRGSFVRVLNLPLWWLLGNLMVLGPWWLRNIQTFGGLQPYEMARSTVGLLENIRFFLFAQIKDIAGLDELAKQLAWSVPGLLAVGFIVIGLSFLIIRSFPLLDSRRQIVTLFAAGYILIGSALVIYARTRYQWGVLINVRHTLQYTPFVFLILAILATRLPISTRLMVGLTATVFSCLLGFRLLHVQAYSDRVDFSTRNLPTEFFGLPKVADPICVEAAQPQAPTVISNYAYLYRVRCAADALNPDLSEGESFRFIDIASRLPSDAAYLVRLHPGHGIKPEMLPLSPAQVAEIESSGGRVIENSKETLAVLMRPPG